MCCQELAGSIATCRCRRALQQGAGYACLLTSACPCHHLLQEGLGRAEWVHHCAYRGGSDLAFLGDTGSQLVVAGQGDRGGCISLWDTLLPPESACVHEVRGWEEQGG